MSFGRNIGFNSENQLTYTGGTLVILGSNAGTMSYTSTNGGVTWVRTSGLPNTSGWQDCTYSPYYGTAYTVSSTRAQFAWSKDHQNWATASMLGTNHQNISISDDSGVAIAGCNNTGSNVIISGIGGTTSWATGSTPVLRAGSMGTSMWISSLQLFVMAGSGGKILTSPDGSNWTDRSVEATADWSSIDVNYDKGIIILGSATGTLQATSSTGLTWSKTTTGNPTSCRGIAYSPTLRRWVATDYTTSIKYSDNDGVTWTASSSGNRNWWFVKWLPEYGWFHAVVLNGLATYRSTDGITWTASSAILSNTWCNQYYAPGRGSQLD